ncbi:MAG: C40 family peptidase [Bacteroidales bacterium]|nr:C40 family peptidase [Bacteroidales bacterium]
MVFGISEISVIPVRKENNERSELVTQILFGELFQIVEQNDDWTYIKNRDDDHEGWISSSCISVLNETEFNQIIKSDSHILKSITEDVLISDTNEIIRLPFGSTLPNFNKNNATFSIKKRQYKLKNISTTNINNDILSLAKIFLNSPYLWGGKNPFGIDCSGFTQVIFKAIGQIIPRDSYQQVKLGNTINFIGDTQIGDLAFFDNNEGIITHVGIIIDNNNIIHSSIKVRIDKIDQQGIFNTELNKYTHKLRIIKRIII